ncbi:MAG UNVERIFIED_CONTAM: sigma-54 dependent transcriptional regulator [Rickettsiaceae bacterium]|jgi:DNA-binding NtrC family response regulator
MVLGCFFETDIKAGLEYLRNGSGADLVLIDCKLDIASFISSLSLEHINTDVVAYGVSTSPKEAVAAIKAGAKEFLPLPPDEKLIAALFTAISDNTRPMIASSHGMRQITEIADQIAPSDAHILITGKSGTGKEVMAHYIHNKSKRVQKPFVRVNCAAIPENLLESELFGHEKGAFTGAIARRIGKFEEASGGTLLLDEISEMSPHLQAKLLRAVQEQEIDRVGGVAPVKVDLRIIATSNRDLEKEIEKGTFREDLYFRLNIVNIELPKLSDRKEDIVPLTEFFIKKYCENNNINPYKTLSDEAKEFLLSYNWPGNIRELENTIHRAVLLAKDIEITKSDFMIKPRNFSGKTLDSAEKELIMNTMQHCLGDSTIAANILGISITRLQRKTGKLLLRPKHLHKKGI